ncbi:MAG: hypothetical protein CMP41_01100 [Rickettsiales bacterium]|nr:hypothetical protein [Rickettsiales bacterium]
MSKKCKISIRDISIIVELKRTETAKKIWDILPFHSKISTWGKEIYFDCEVQVSLEEESKSIINYGEIVFWPSGSCIAIGYGKTPISIDDEIRLADRCNVWGISNSNLNFLNYCSDGDIVLIEKINV